MEFDKTVLLDILDRVLRSWWTIVAGMCLGTAGSVCAMHYLPKIYQARSKIFVAPPKVPQDLVRTTVEDDMSLRLEALQQAVLSRPYMEKLIESEFKPLFAATEDRERLIRTVRSKVSVLVINNVIEISYRDRDPVRAAAVVNTLADTFIQENTRYRTARAGETTKTIQEIASRVRADLDAQEKRIADYKSAHLYETADRQQANLQLLASRRTELEAKEAEIADAREALRVISEMGKEAESSPATVTKGSSGSSGSGGRMAALERELQALKVRYSDEHPQVKAKQRELDEAKAVAKAEGENPRQAAAPKPAPSDPWKAQRSMMEEQIRGLEAAAQKIRDEIALYERRIERTPQVDLELSELSKGYDVLLEQYRSYQQKLESAKTSQEMEEARKGEQFEVLDRAYPPSVPIQPAPLMVFGLGIVVGLAGFVGPIVLLSLLRPLVNSEARLRAIAPTVPLLVSIPRLPVPATVRGDRQRRMRNLGLSAISIVVLATAVVLFH
jgi:polysaccharide chain length determinant protein (PEP-CTERM system associated)